MYTLAMKSQVSCVLLLCVYFSHVTHVYGRLYVKYALKLSLASVQWQYCDSNTASSYYDKLKIFKALVKINSSLLQRILHSKLKLCFSLAKNLNIGNFFQTSLI